MRRRSFLAAASSVGIAGSSLSVSALNQSGSDTLIDVFLVAGQSNAEGMGSASDSPTIDEGVGYEYSDGQLVHLDDPVGTANTGSAWPTFARKYYKYTNRPVVIVATAEGNTPQTAPLADSAEHWDSGGSLAPAAVQKLHNCLDLLPNIGFAPKFRGVLWNQGEADAFGIVNDKITPEDYEGAFRGLVDRFQNDIRVSGWGMFVFETAVLLGDDGYGTVSERQFQVAAERPHVHVVFDRGEYYQSQGWSDWVHYRQVGYNKMGMSAAKSVDRIVKQQ